MVCGVCVCVCVCVCRGGHMYIFTKICSQRVCSVAMHANYLPLGHYGHTLLGRTDGELPDYEPRQAEHRRDGLPGWRYHSDGNGVR